MAEFKKAKNDEEEFNSFAFATNCLFAFYGLSDDFIRLDEYEKISSKKSSLTRSIWWNVYNDHCIIKQRDFHFSLFADADCLNR